MGLDFLAKTKRGETALEPKDQKGLNEELGISTQGELDRFEISNIDEGRTWLSSARPKDPWSLDFSKKLHQKLFGNIWNWAGQTRKSNTNLGVLWTQVEVQLVEFFKDLEYWLKNKTYSEKEIITIFHHRTVSIHPFPNGNGRWSRIYTEYFAKKEFNLKLSWGKDLPKELIRKQYLSSLKKADDGELDHLSNFIFN